MPQQPCTYQLRARSAVATVSRLLIAGFYALFRERSAASAFAIALLAQVLFLSWVPTGISSISF